MNCIKKIIIAGVLLTLTACATHTQSAPKKMAANLRSKHHQAFEVLGETAGENELDYAKIADGEVVYSNDNVSNSKTSVKFRRDFTQVGLASWYGKGFHGKKTANGAKFDQHAYSAAHPDLPMPSVVRVVNLNNQRSVLVVVNDRGPNHAAQKNGRVIDLSRQAAKDLGVLANGIAKVRVEYLHDETLKLLKKYPPQMQAKAGQAMESAMKKHMVQLNRDIASN